MSSVAISRLAKVAVVLAVVYALVLFSQSRQTFSGTEVAIDLKSVAASADKLVMKNADAAVTLERDGKQWKLKKKSVKSGEIDRLLSAIESFGFTRRVSDSAGDAGQYGLAKDQAKSLEIYQGKRLLRKLTIGSTTAVDQFYVMVDGDKAVYEAQSTLSGLVEQPSSAWIVKTPKASGKSESRD